MLSGDEAELLRYLLSKIQFLRFLVNLHKLALLSISLQKKVNVT